MDLTDEDKSRFFWQPKTPSKFNSEKALCDLAEAIFPDISELVGLPETVKLTRECPFAFRALGDIKTPRQHSKARMDFLAQHNGNKYTILEAKITKNSLDLVQAIAQLLFYRTLLQTYHEIPHGDIRLVILADKIDWSVMATIKENNLNIDCVAIQPDGLLYGAI
jgi:hypothetical protein